jgi:hypothetical protein
MPVCASRNVGTPDSAEIPAPVSAEIERALRRRSISAAGMAGASGTDDIELGGRFRDPTIRGVG